MRSILLAFVLACGLHADPHRVLYVTHSAGYRHASIETSIQALRSIGARSGKFMITQTEDLSQISAENLKQYDAILFFTSGELALDAAQRSAFLEFIRSGKGFAGFHSATDTLYLWPDYGELIGGYFDGHPWVQPARVTVEDRNHPVTSRVPSPLGLTEEFYQFRNFSRDRVHVLMTLDVTSVDLSAPGAHTETTDFPSAWVRYYGDGRVFYTALGHFDETWLDARFQLLVENGISWILRNTDDVAIGNSATMQPPDTISPGALISVYGSNLAAGPPEVSVKLGEASLPLLYTSATQINGLIPWTIPVGTATLRIMNGASEVASRSVSVVDAAPGIFLITRAGNTATVWATGLPQGRHIYAVVGQSPARVTSSGVSPQFAGLWQINIEIPENTPPGKAAIGIGLSSDGPFVYRDTTLP